VNCVATFTVLTNTAETAISGVLMEMTMKITAFWDVTPCRLADHHCRFGGKFLLRHYVFWRIITVALGGVLPAYKASVP
jgi:hypothetical protein